MSRYLSQFLLEGSEKRYNYLDLARELKKWNMKVAVITGVTGALGAVTKGFVLENMKKVDNWIPYKVQHC